MPPVIIEDHEVRSHHRLRKWGTSHRLCAPIAFNPDGRKWRGRCGAVMVIGIASDNARYRRLRTAAELVSENESCQPALDGCALLAEGCLVELPHSGPVPMDALFNQVPHVCQMVWS